MEDTMRIPEIMGLLLSWVDDKTLHSCCCADHLWLELAAAEARQRVETNEAWLQPLALALSPEEGANAECRWWLRLHSDTVRFLGTAALQFAYCDPSDFLIFRDRKRPFYNTPTKQDCFPVSTQPTILSMNWGMLWWEDIGILLKDCAYDGVFGYKGSLEPFTCADIAQVMSVNGAWYIYSYEERAFLAIFLLKDGRFVFLLEGSETGTIDSGVRIHAKCIFASSLQQLLFFGLGDANREDLGIQLDPKAPPQTKNKTVRLQPSKHEPCWLFKSILTTSAFALHSFFQDRRELMKLHKKSKESWRGDAANAVTFDQLEQYLTFPVARLFAHTQKLGLCMFQGPHQFRLGMAPEKRPPSMKEHPTLPANLSSQSTTAEDKVLWNKDWSEEQKREHQLVWTEFESVWGLCPGFHSSLGWLE
ncbi:hypothetical protein QOT17_017483 [Balamuthia mandrillaris]